MQVELGADADTLKNQLQEAADPDTVAVREVVVLAGLQSLPVKKRAVTRVEIGDRESRAVRTYYCVPSRDAARRFGLDLHVGNGPTTDDLLAVLKGIDG